MYIYICIHKYIYFAITNVVRQQIFTLHGLAWKDYTDDIANEMLEEILSMNREKHQHEDSRKIHPTLAALSTYYYVQDHGATITRTTTDNETITKTGDLKKNALRSSWIIVGLIVCIDYHKERIVYRKKATPSSIIKNKGFAISSS